MQLACPGGVGEMISTYIKRVGSSGAGWKEMEEIFARQWDTVGPAYLENLSLFIFLHARHRESSAEHRDVFITL